MFSLDINNIFNSSLEFTFFAAFILLPLPLLIRFILPAAPIKNKAALRIPFYQKLQTNIAPYKKSRSLIRLVRLVLAILAWIFLVIAAARPQFIGETVRQPLAGRSLMMAMDISGSMQIRDMVVSGRNVTRLTAVKAVASDFIDKREGDRLGLILFGTQAYLQTPLTFDRKTVNILLNEAALGLAGRETAIGDAIGLAVKRLREVKEENRVLIILTDGANTAGNVDPLKAADLAAQEKIKIYTIGVGADDRIIQTPFGKRRVGGGDLDEVSLQAIAEKTKGRYFRAKDVEGLFKIYEVLDKIEPLSEDNLSYRPVKELYTYPLAIALILSVLIALLNIVPFSVLLSSNKKQTKKESAI